MLHVRLKISHVTVRYVCDFSEMIVKLLPVLKVTNNGRTHDERLQERKRRHLVAQIYTVWTCNCVISTKREWPSVGLHCVTDTS